MDKEILRTMAIPEFLWQGRRSFRWISWTFFQHVKSRPSIRVCVPFSPGYPDFIASFLAERPHSQDPWNSNISSVLNHVIDGILLADGVEVNDNLRKRTMRALCRQVFEMKRWRVTLDWFSSELFPLPNFKFPDQTESLEFNVLLANVVLGRRTTLTDLEQDIPALMARKSIVMGTLLEACIISKQPELVSSLLATGVEVNDTSLEILEAAVQSNNTEIMRLIFSQQYSISSHTLHTAIHQAVKSDCTQAVLYLLRPCDPPVIPKDDSYLWYIFHWACYHNNFPVVKFLIEELKWVDPKEIGRPRDLLKLTVYYGHKNMLRYLLDIGVTYEGYPLMIAAVNRGEISMIRFLLRDCGVIVEKEEWYNLLTLAVRHGTRRHSSLIEALFSDPSLLETQPISTERIFDGPVRDYADLFINACYYGNIFIVRRIAEAGADLDHVERYEDRPPVLAAQMAGQQVVLDVLIEKGAKPVDPMDTNFREQFENGEYPRNWKKIIRDYAHPGTRMEDGSMGG